MIRNDQELAAAQAQIAHLQRVLQQMRPVVSGAEFRLLARSSRPTIERIQREVLEYLTRPSSQILQIPTTAPAASA
jgi:hypothetical protein